MRGHPVTALDRDPAHFKTFQDLGVEAVQGDFGNTDLITDHARSTNITANPGDSDDFGPTNAGHHPKCRFCGEIEDLDKHEA